VLSATRTSASQVAASSAPDPATMAGRSAEASSSTSASTAAGSTAAARTTDPGAASLAGSAAGAPQSSIGATTIAGPFPVLASWYARPIAPGRSCGRAGSSNHTGYSPASDRSRPVRNGSCGRCRRSCCPTRTTRGARLTRAVASAPTALPSPAVVCRSASAGSPRASARPVAIPTTEASCSASTNSRSSGRSVRNGTSVDPGLPKRTVSRRSRRTSTTASRTVVAGTVRQ
jgi:hypothetical protein